MKIINARYEILTPFEERERVAEVRAGCENLL